MTCRLDHVAVAASTLEEGAGWVEALLGAAPVAGGKHPLMGTHNRLMRLGDDAYLEVIAIDPDAMPPERPRWFGLDAPDTRDRLRRHGPGVIGWIARTDDIAASLAASLVPSGVVANLSRGDLRWKFGLLPDGLAPEGGALPHLIEWPSGFPGPQSGLPEQGMAFGRLEIAHPDPNFACRALSAIGIDRHGIKIARADRKGVSAIIRRPDGTAVTLPGLGA